MPPVLLATRGIATAKKVVGGAKKVLSARDSARGISTVKRFERKQTRRLLQSELQAGGRRGAPQEEDTPSSEAQRDRVSQQETEAYILENELASLKKATGFNYDRRDIDVLIKNPPRKPSFPIIIFTMAVLKDIIDLVGLTGVGMIITKGISIVVALVLFIYYLGKMGGIQRWLWKRYVFATIIGLTPVLGEILPETTLLVLLAHNHENKVAAGITKGLETAFKKGLI